MLGGAAPRLKSPEAFRTISEVSEDLDVPQHVLRFWESRFAHIRPVKRAGGRRYYRPEDVDLLRGIRTLLYADGYTIRGVQKILKDRGVRHVVEIGRGEARAERAMPEPDSTPEAIDPFDAPLVPPEEPQHARAAIAKLERAHAEGELLPLVQEPIPEPAIDTEPASPSLSSEQRVRLEFLLAELLSFKKRLGRRA
jgi:DNA-binding transcriptional MerR regulator